MKRLIDAEELKKTCTQGFQVERSYDDSKLDTEYKDGIDFCLKVIIPQIIDDEPTIDPCENCQWVEPR